MKIIIVGYGRMGRLIEQTAISLGHEIAATIDIDNIDDLKTMDTIADIVIDFSSPAALKDVAEYIKRTHTAYLSGATGYKDEHYALIKSLGAYAPVLYSSNYSLGVAVMKRVLAEITPILEDTFDIEVCETHHNQKADAPSGTAIALLDAIDPDGKYERVYGREGITGKRTKKEIGVHSLRGGTVAGIHTVSYFGTDEILEITHNAGSRQIFVNGALAAAKKLVEHENKFYELSEVLF